ncbi:MAG: ribosome-associated translation inhibitor RaiA [Planctomycetes bacterium]|nr:ribosome-associated translation inhibitor RaiA [Planctomycetota bacterium]
MKVIITLRDASIEDEAREYAREKIDQLEHYFERITSVEVILSIATNHKNRKRAEFVIHANRGVILVASAESEEVKAAIDRAHAEVKRELLRHKERLTDHHKARKQSEKRKAGTS